MRWESFILIDGYGRCLVESIIESVWGDTTVELVAAYEGDDYETEIDFDNLPDFTYNQVKEDVYSDYVFNY